MQLFDPSGTEIARQKGVWSGSASSFAHLELPAGSYRLVLRVPDEEPTDRAVSITAGKRTTILLEAR